LRWDPQSSKAAETKIFLDAVSNAIEFNVIPTDNAFVGIAIAATSYAIQKGWSSEASTSPDDVDHAMKYITTLLRKAANTSVILQSNIPYWLSLVIQSIARTTIKSRGGKLTYAFKSEVNTEPSAAQDIGPGIYNHKWLSYKLSSLSPVNFYWPQMIAPSGYTDDKGEQAANAMFQFMVSRHEGNKMHTMVPYGGTNIMTQDTSAYSRAIIAPGGGFGATGAQRMIVSHEVPIRSPLFSVFAGIDQTPGRSPNFSRSWGGDSIFLGGSLASWTKESQIHKKTPPNFKFIDFNEFF
jgi:hypothetical protein